MTLRDLLFAVACAMSTFAATPDAKWLAMAGGSGFDMASSVAVDGEGNLYVTGRIESTNAMFGSHSAIIANGSAMFVAKYDRSGSNLWVTLGGTPQGEGRGIALDESGNVYVVGHVHSTPSQSHTFGVTNLISHGVDLFLAKFDNNGQYQWVRQVWSPSGYVEMRQSLTIAGTNLYFAGTCNNGLSSGTAMLTNSGLFVAIFDLEGHPVRAHHLAQVANPIAASVSQLAVDNDGSFYLGIIFSDPILSFGGTNVTRVSQSADSAFAKWDMNGNLLWFRHLQGSTSRGLCNGTAMTADGDILVCGSTRFGNGSFAGQPVSGGFVARLTPDGEVRWLSNLATSVEPRAIITDSSENIFICSALPPGVSQFGNLSITNHSPDWSSYVARLDPAGNPNWVLCSGAITNFDSDFFAIAIDPTGSVYLGGYANTWVVTLGTKTATAGYGTRHNILLARIAPESPSLRIARAFDGVMLSWPTNQPGFSPDYAESSGGSWTPLLTPVSRIDRNFVTTAPVTNSARFFRLREE